MNCRIGAARIRQCRAEPRRLPNDCGERRCTLITVTQAVNAFSYCLQRSQGSSTLLPSFLQRVPYLSLTGVLPCLKKDVSLQRHVHPIRPITHSTSAFYFCLFMFVGAMEARATCLFILILSSLADASVLNLVTRGPSICQTYTVQADDTCFSISSQNNITYAQILSWNPTIDPTCL